MKPLLLGILFGLSGQTAFAGNITLQGVSNLRHPVEFVTIRLDLRARCAESPVQSSQLTEKVKDQLKTIVLSHFQQGASSRDQIIESGSTTGVQDEYEKNNELLCKQGWTTSQSLIIKTLLLKEVSAIRIELLQAIAKTSIHQKNMLISMSAPRPSLLPETVANLETEAMKSALVDASKKLSAVQQVCEMKDVKITEIQSSGGVIRDYADGDVSAGDLNFDQQYVHQAWNVTWSFINTTGTCQ